MNLGRGFNMAYAGREVLKETETGSQTSNSNYTSSISITNREAFILNLPFVTSILYNKFIGSYAFVS